MWISPARATGWNGGPTSKQSFSEGAELWVWLRHRRLPASWSTLHSPSPQLCGECKILSHWLACLPLPQFLYAVGPGLSHRIRPVNLFSSDVELDSPFRLLNAIAKIALITAKIIASLDFISAVHIGFISYTISSLIHSSRDH